MYSFDLFLVVLFLTQFIVIVLKFVVSARDAASKSSKGATSKTAPTGAKSKSWCWWMVSQ